MDVLFDGPRGRSWQRWLGGLGGLLVAAIGLGLTACDTPVQIHGHVNDPDSFEAIKTGEYTEDDVLSLLGTPSTVSTFDNNKWYYIGYKATQFAFERPEVLERNVLMISFDEAGVVDQKQVFTLEDGRQIDFVSRETPTEGRNFTMLQQFLGNIGRLPGSSESGGRNVPNIPGP